MNNRTEHKDFVKTSTVYATIIILVLCLFLSSFLGYKIGYDTGFDEGNQIGYNKGDQNGHQRGESEGYIKGKDDGYKSGFSEGEVSGYNEGFNDGSNLGYSSEKKIGYSEGYSSVTSDIIGNAKRLLGEYNDKLNLITEIQQRTDALGTAATREYYIEWYNRNVQAIDAGERLASYVRENINALNENNWASDLLTLIATNKERLDRDNQGLFQIIAR